MSESNWSKMMQLAYDDSEEYRNSIIEYVEPLEKMYKEKKEINSNFESFIKVYSGIILQKARDAQRLSEIENRFLDTILFSYYKKEEPEKKSDSVSEKEIVESPVERLMKVSPKVEDTHTRHTFLVKNEYLERIKQLAEGKHGYIKQFINYSIELVFREIDEQESRKS